MIVRAKIAVTSAFGGQRISLRTSNRFRLPRRTRSGRISDPEDATLRLGTHLRAIKDD